MTQTAIESGLVANGNVTVQSDESINLEGATLSSGEILALSATGEEAQNVTLNEDGNYVNADGELVGNITLGTQELHSSSWDESSSSYRGIAKELVKFTTFVAASTFMKVEVEIGKSDAVRTDYVTQAVTSVQANDLNIDAKNDVALIGTDVYVLNNAAINANNVTIDAALETNTHSESHTDHTMTSDGASFSKDKGELTLMSLSEIDKTDKVTTTASTWKGATLDVGNLNINAEENVAIVASDIIVENDANIEGNNVLIGGREDTIETNTEDITKTKTLTVGVKNAYVDVLLAVKALKEAKDAVDDAKNALSEAKKKVEAGTLPKGDLAFYVVNLTAASANVVNAGLAILTAGATAAASTATYGFTATAGATTQTDKTSTVSTQGSWNGSSIQVGGNTDLTADNNLTVQGSNVNTAGALNLDAENTAVTAGTNTYNQSTKSSSVGAGATVTVSASGVSASGSANASKSSNSSNSTDYVNSNLTAGSIVSNSDSLTIEGGNVNAGSVDITTNTLVVASLQDTATSESKSVGANVGFGGSGVSSIGVNASKGSSDKAWVNQESGITGQNINITAKDTTITGATIAAVDTEGNTTDNLTLVTDTLTVADIKDIDESYDMSLGVSVSGLSLGKGEVDSAKNKLLGTPLPEETNGKSVNTTKQTYSAGFDGYEKEQTTKATLGFGNITVGGSDINEQSEFADLNRDVATSQEITKDMERGGLDVSVTVDARLFSEDGRNLIKKDAVDSAMHVNEIGEAISDVANTDQSILDVYKNVQSYAKQRIELTKKAMDEDAQKKLKGEAGAEGSEDAIQDISDALTKAEGLEEGANIALFDGSQIDDDTVAIDKTAVNKKDVEGAYHENSDTILVNIDNTDMTNSTAVVTTLVHEQTRHTMAQDGSTGSLSRDDQTTIATNHGDQAGQVWNVYSSLAGISTQSTTSNQSTWNAANASSASVVAGTSYMASIDKSELKARQLEKNEASLLDQAKASINSSSVLTTEAKKERTDKLNQLACAEVKCAAGVSVNDPLYNELKALQNDGEALIAKGEDIHDTLHELGVETPTTKNGRMQRVSETSFRYNGVTALQDLADSKEMYVARAVSGTQVVSGIVAVDAGAALSATGVGALIGVPMAGIGAYSYTEGVNDLSQDYVYSNGDRVLDSFSLATHQGDNNILADAALDIGLNVAGGAVAKIAAKGYSVAKVGDDVVGNVNGTFDAFNLGPLKDDLAGTFTGGRYQSITLANDTTLYRAGTLQQPLGQFFSTDAPTGIMQTRIDKAVLPVWPNGTKSTLDTVFEVNIPAGTQVHVGEVSSQGGVFVGGTQQIIVQEPWTIDGVSILNSRVLNE